MPPQVLPEGLNDICATSGAVGAAEIELVCEKVLCGCYLTIQKVQAGGGLYGFFLKEVEVEVIG